MLSKLLQHYLKSITLPYHPTMIVLLRLDLLYIELSYINEYSYIGSYRSFSLANLEFNMGL